MPDITMCTGTDCQRNDTCYRHTATPTPDWQSYFSRPPLEEENRCRYYWPADTSSEAPTGAPSRSHSEQ